MEIYLPSIQPFVAIHILVVQCILPATLQLLE